MYGNLPKVDVSRAFNDQADDVARVAAMAMQRLLENDIAENGLEYNTVLRSTLLDRLLPGLGCARIRYTFDEGVNPETQQPEATNERAPADYFYWGDVLWGWCRSFSDMPWLAYRSYLTEDEATERWGEGVAKDLTYEKQLPTNTEDSKAQDDPDQASAWQKTEVWEVWDKSKREVVYISIKGGHDKVLETKPDPLGLTQFYPSPPFLLANPTTSLYMPTPDFNMAQDLYNEIDVLQSRIATLTSAVKVIGVYDSAADGVQRMFSEGTDNTLIPVENWAIFGEKGGITGAVQWLPLQDVVNALQTLTQIRDETIALLYQITGMSDIMRGSSDQYKGVGQVQTEAKMGSVRIQALEDEFGQFASDLMQLKAEVIARHFSPKSIVSQANLTSIMEQDQQYIMPAVQLIKQPETAKLRAKIRPESVGMVDYASMQQERTEYINAIAVFFQSTGPIIADDPSTKPFMLQLLQWGLAGFKGAGEIEGVIDSAISASEQQAKEGEKPDPAMQAAQMAQQQSQMDHHFDMQLEQAKTQGTMAVRDHDKQADMETAAQATQLKMQERSAEIEAKLAEIQAKMYADLAVEQAQLQGNIATTNATVEGEIKKDVVSTQLEVESEGAKAAMKINEIAASAQADIAKEAAKPAPTGKSDAKD